MNIRSARLISIARIDGHPAWHLPAQIHTNHELIVVISGKIHAEINGRHVLGAAGDALFYRAGWLHEEWSDAKDPFVTYGIAFHCDRIPEATPARLRDKQARLRQLCQWLTEESPMFPSEVPPANALLFQCILAEWQRLGGRQEHEMIEATRRYIREHLDQPLALADLARSAGLSKFYYLRLYKKLCGRTPTEELWRLRTDFARHLLLTTDLPLKSIAPRCGIADEYHLCKLFRRYYRMTPGDARRGVAAPG